MAQIGQGRYHSYPILILSNCFNLPHSPGYSSGDQRIPRTLCALAALLLQLTNSLRNWSMFVPCKPQIHYIHLHPLISISIYPNCESQFFFVDIDMFVFFSSSEGIHSIFGSTAWWMLVTSTDFFQRQVYLGTSSPLQRLCGCRHVVHHRG